MLKDKRVAGTVMLNLEDGSKKFLVRATENKLELASTALYEERTGLANILQLLKETVHLDISSIHLVELTNGCMNNRNIPLFVFEAQERDQPDTLPANYGWKEPRLFRQIIQDYDIDGMPFF